MPVRSFGKIIPEWKFKIVTFRGQPNKVSYGKRSEASPINENCMHYFMGWRSYRYFFFQMAVRSWYGWGGGRQRNGTVCIMHSGRIPSACKLFRMDTSTLSMKSAFHSVFGSGLYKKFILFFFSLPSLVSFVPVCFNYKIST